MTISSGFTNQPKLTNSTVICTPAVQQSENSFFFCTVESFVVGYSTSLLLLDNPTKQMELPPGNDSPGEEEQRPAFGQPPSAK